MFQLHRDCSRWHPSSSLAGWRCSAPPSQGGIGTGSQESDRDLLGRAHNLDSQSTSTLNTGLANSLRMMLNALLDRSLYPEGRACTRFGQGFHQRDLPCQPRNPCTHRCLRLKTCPRRTQCTDQRPECRNTFLLRTDRKVLLGLCPCRIDQPHNRSTLTSRPQSACQHHSFHRRLTGPHPRRIFPECTRRK